MDALRSLYALFGISYLRIPPASCYAYLDSAAHTMCTGSFSSMREGWGYSGSGALHWPCRRPAAVQPAKAINQTASGTMRGACKGHSRSQLSRNAPSGGGTRRAWARGCVTFQACTTYVVRRGAPPRRRVVKANHVQEVHVDSSLRRASHV